MIYILVARIQSESTITKIKKPIRFFDLAPSHSSHLFYVNLITFQKY